MTLNTRATSVAVMSFIFYRKLRELIDLCIQIQLKSVSSNNSSQYHTMTPSDMPTLHIPNEHYPLGQECEITPKPTTHVIGVDLQAHHKHT